MQKRGCIVSIPYRHAKNTEEQKQKILKLQFQFLIGTLKTGVVNFDGTNDRKFQFLIGTLKTGLSSWRRTDVYMFQFLIGTLKTSLTPK